MRTTQTNHYHRPLTRNNSAYCEGRTTEPFWIRRPTAALLVVYFIMVVGVGCILELESRPSTREAAPSTHAFAARTDLVPIAARSSLDSSRPQDPTWSSHE